MQTVINKLILAVSFQEDRTKTDTSAVMLPLILAAAMVIMMVFCFTQNINLFAE